MRGLIAFLGGSLVLAIMGKAGGSLAWRGTAGGIGGLGGCTIKGSAPQSSGVATAAGDGGEAEDADRGTDTGTDPDPSIAAAVPGCDGGGIVIVGAAAEAASSAVGTVTGTPQYGHFTRFPADSSRALNRLPHEGQPIVMGMIRLRQLRMVRYQ